MHNLQVVTAGLLFFAAPLLAEVKITYLANEGVMLVSGKDKVLVDALFRDSVQGYARHDSATQERLETGQAPYDGVTLALATHFHLDHWDPGAISRFLTSSSKAVFASSQQATAMIPNSVQNQIRELGPGSRAGSALTVGGVAVEAIPLRHGPGVTENLGYKISMGGKVIVHLGDAEPETGNFNSLAAKGSPDVALVPFWWLLSSQPLSFIRERWKPKAVVAIHFGTTPDVDGAAQKVQGAFGQAWLCRKPGESRTY